MIIKARELLERSLELTLVTRSSTVAPGLKQAVAAELLVRAELWPFRSRNMKVIHINHCCIHWDLDRE